MTSVHSLPRHQIAISEKVEATFSLSALLRECSHSLRFLEIFDHVSTNVKKMIPKSSSHMSHTYFKKVDCCNGVLDSKVSFSKLQLLQLLRNHSSRTCASPAHLIPIDGSWQVCNKNCTAVLGTNESKVQNVPPIDSRTTKPIFQTDLPHAMCQCMLCHLDTLSSTNVDTMT